jgi:predicted MPP superfamily phosphohydrolase
MKRLMFLRIAMGSLAVLLLIFSCKVRNTNIPVESGLKEISFMICADVHQDFFPNTREPLKQFIREAEEKKVEFIIQLGDFCYPEEENEDLMAVWNSFHRNKYYVLGNHDIDKCSKSDVLDYIQY